jgi:hypothetical protein
MDVPDQPNDKPTTPQVQATFAAPLTGLTAMSSAVLIIPIVFFIAFHVGAGYLSYQKYGSMAWAFLDFLFAYFYYPYYAFFLAKEPAPTPMMPAMIGGRKGLVHKLLGKYFK